MSDPFIEVKKMWQIFSIGQYAAFEIRAIWPKGINGNLPPVIKRYRAADYLNTKDYKMEIEHKILDLNERGYNVYAVMNPLHKDVKVDTSGGAKDIDVLYRSLLLVDIDRKGDTSQPADQMELEAAKNLAISVKEFTRECGWSEPIVVMSGNGYHLYYVLDDIPNDITAAHLVSGSLKTLANVFDNSIVGIDTAVYNASRITKVPGTIMRKGIATDKRPYRLAVVCDEF